MKNIIYMLAIFLIALNASAAQDLYPFQSEQKQQQFVRLTQELRCLVCQNENLADSNASLAQELRQQVYQMVKAGQSDQQIKQYMVQRYGDFVLFKPPVNRLTYVLWFGPIIMLLMGFLILIVVIRRRNQQVTI